MEAKVLNIKGQETGRTVVLNDAVYAIEPNDHAIYLDVKLIMANKRQGTQSALTRAEVSGGGRKPWRQKGTGRARQGSTRSPQWTHGGIVFAPKPRDYGFSVNKKVKRLAMKSALSTKVASDELIVVDKIVCDDYKTKTMVEMLNAIDSKKKTLIVLPEVDSKVIKSANNIPGVKTCQYNEINVYDILNADKLVIAEEAIAKIEEVYA